MRFGILLLVLIAALSVVGTVIPQGREISWYAQTYQSFHGTILLLRQRFTRFLRRVPFLPAIPGRSLPQTER